METETPSPAARLWRIAVSLIPFFLLGYYFLYVPVEDAVSGGNPDPEQLVAQFAGVPAGQFTVMRSASDSLVFTWDKGGNYSLRIVRRSGAVLLEAPVSGSRWSGMPELPAESCYWILLDGREVVFAGRLDPLTLPPPADGKLQ